MVVAPGAAMCSGSRIGEGLLEMLTESSINRLADKAEVVRLLHLASECGEPDRHVIKRRSRRVSSVIRLEVTKDSQEPSASFSAILHNISCRGLAFWSKDRLVTGDVVFLREFDAEEPRPWLVAGVRHCTVGIRGFLIGAAFETPADVGDAEDSESPDSAAGNEALDTGLPCAGD